MPTFYVEVCVRRNEVWAVEAPSLDEADLCVNDENYVPVVIYRNKFADVDAVMGYTPEAWNALMADELDEEGKSV